MVCGVPVPGISPSRLAGAARRILSGTGAALRAAIAAAALAAVLPLCVAAPAAAQQQASVDEQVNLLMQRGDYAAALALAERAWGPETPNRQARLDFIRGMKLRSEGDLKGAIDLFRRLIADNPGFTRVRVELANTLVLAGDTDAAAYHLRDLARSAHSDDMRRNFEAYLDAIRRDRPYRIGGYLSLAPSTNVNGRTTEEVIVLPIQGVGCPNDLCTFTIDRDSQAVSGVGLTGGISGERHFFLSDELTFTLSGRLDAIKYARPEFDRLTANAGAHLRRKRGDITLGGGIVASYQNIGYATYREAAGLELEYGRAMAPGTNLLLSGSVLYQRFADFPIMDGFQFTAGAVVGHALGPGQSVTTGLSFTSERTGAPFLDYDGARAFVGYGREWNGGFITYVEPSATVRGYRGVDPNFNVVRNDIEIGGRISLSHRKLNFMGVMPRFEYSYSRQFSTIVFQRRETHSANIVLTREF